MKTLLLRIEPVIWLLFGQGILIGTMLLTPWLLVVGILMPLGVVPADALAYERALALATAAPFGIPIGPLLLLGIAVLPLWKGAHHIRSFCLDLMGGDADVIVGPLCYTIALVASILAIVAVVRLY